MQFNSIPYFNYVGHLQKLYYKYVGGLRATRSLSVEVPGAWVYILVFFNLYSSSYVLFTESLNELC